MPITADPPITIAQYFEPEANVDVVSSGTINAAGNLLIATPIGQNDQMIPPSELAKILASTGIVAVGTGLELDIAGLTQSVIADDADQVAIETTAGKRRMSRADFLAGTTGITDLSHTINGDASIIMESSTGLNTSILVATAARTGFLSSIDWARFDAASGAAVDLSVVLSPTTVTIANTAGNDAPIPLVNATDAGVMSPGDFTKLGGIAPGATGVTIHSGAVTSDVFGVVTQSANSIGAIHIQPTAVNNTHLAIGAITIVNDALAPAVVTSAKLAAAAVSATHIQANAVNDTHMAVGAITIANDALDAVVVTSSKLALVAVDTQHLIDKAVTNLKLGDNSVDTNKLQLGSVENSNMAIDAIDTPNIVLNAVDLGNIQQVVADSVACNPSAIGADLQEAIHTDFSIAAAPIAASQKVLAFSPTGTLELVQVGDIPTGTSRKDGQDNLGNQVGAIVVDFDLGNYDQKIIRLTGDVALTLAATRPGTYQLWAEQSSGYNSITMATSTSPGGIAHLARGAGAVTIYFFILDHNLNWHW